METFKSNLSANEFPKSEMILGKTIRLSIFNLIKSEYPKFTKNSTISISELNYYRQKYLETYLIKEAGELSNLEEDVLQSIEKQGLISDNLLLKNNDVKSNFGQRLADKVASFGGSWKFIILFSVIIFLWITANIVLLANKGYDPYPFILLNLILSCLAAFQAPVIMMSQNRQEEKDRDRAQQDYMINLKAELEIRTLHEKLDHLIIHQQQELLNIQKVQVEMMEDIMKQINTKKNE
ncbi:hypothetical protein KCTC32516_00387 [Polaribacter huanghezhanensis]|uniref:DUF1003 domain-containing protein n=1 Tax=Polaribacter huanghezhanensis TaxID=1354726 RepID=UPI0026491D0A|nr:DUF1003 domain-containing protein [Polaribacter huanghezhanensis]WKD85049.1 hypothetical protein KCTC32516_00387 [Polaribacter huanghezhanensis]